MYRFLSVSIGDIDQGGGEEDKDHIYWMQRGIGDQPQDIEKQIRSLIMDFVSNPNR